jgi:anthranilate phosphoribosyltransferase
VEEAAKIFIDILENKGTEEQNNVVIANAAIGLNVYYSKNNLNECVEMARESLKSGKALEKLKKVTAV